MNSLSHDPLRDEIAPLKTPPVSEEKRDHALAQALAALCEDVASDDEKLSWRPWAALAGALCVVLLGLWSPWSKPAPNPAENAGLILAEMEKLFPRHLDSVIVDGTQVRVNVAEAPTESPRDQRIRVVLQKDGRSLGVLTYSGRRVCVHLGQEEVCLTPLMRSDGSVFVLTDSAVITDQSVLPTGHHIHMEHLREVSS